MPVPYTFGTATAAIPLSQLDSNFATAITLGNTAVYLGNTTTSIGNLTLTNVTISSGNVTLTNVSVTTANVSGTANITTLVATNDATISGLTVGKGAGAVATNTVVGATALATNSTSGYQTAIGYQALNLATGQYNTAVGGLALLNNSTGVENVGVGLQALQSNTTGSYNIAIGRQALNTNTTASNNTAVGYQAGYTNSTGAANTYYGYAAGYTGNGDNNTFIGFGAGYNVSSGSKNTIVGLYNGNQGGLDIRTLSNNIVLSDGDGNPRGVFDSSGNFLVGTTSTSFSEKFNSTQSANQKAGLFFNTNASFTNNVLNLRASRNTTNSSYGFLQCSIDGVADKLYIYDSGNVVNTNNSYGALSDVKLKENIVDATPKLDGLMQVKVRNYNLIGDTQKQIGVVAQELEQVFPGMVEQAPDRDAEGNELGTTTKSVKYSVFVPMLIKAIQELKAEVDILKAQLNGASA